MPESKAPLRVGVLFDGREAQAWVMRSLEQVVERTDADITLAVINDSPSEAKTPLQYARKALNVGPWAGIVAARKIRRAAGMGAKYWSEFKRQEPLSEASVLNDAQWLICDPVPAEGFGNELPPAVVKTISRRCDVVIRFGFGILKGDILEATEHGVLSFHHGDLREYRGQPPGFWEFLQGEDWSGVTVQRLTERLDAGEVVALKPVDIADADTWQEVQYRLYNVSDQVLVEAIQNLLTSTSDIGQPEELGELYRLPRLRDTLRYVLKNNL